MVARAEAYSTAVRRRGIDRAMKFHPEAAFFSVVWMAVAIAGFILEGWLAGSLMLLAGMAIAAPAVPAQVVAVPEHSFELRPFVGTFIPVGAMADEPVSIQNSLMADDTLSTLGALQALLPAALAERDAKVAELIADRDQKLAEAEQEAVEVPVARKGERLPLPRRAVRPPQAARHRKRRPRGHELMGDVRRVRPGDARRLRHHRRAGIRIAPARHRAGPGPWPGPTCLARRE